jgi:hypothetical protein
MIPHAQGVATTLIYRKRWVALLRDILENRIAPTFNTIMDEALALTNAEFARQKEAFKNNPDEWVSWEGAWDSVGRDHFKEMDHMHTAVVNIVIAALYHQFEQELWNIFRFLDERDSKTNAVTPGLREIVRLLQAYGLDCTAFTCWTTIEELRLIANIIKHGEGRSSKELIALRPDLFPTDGVSQPFIGRPLIGYGFDVRTRGNARYFDAVIGFWDELTHALQQMGDIPEPK